MAPPPTLPSLKYASRLTPGETPLDPSLEALSPQRHACNPFLASWTGVDAVTAVLQGTRVQLLLVVGGSASVAAESPGAALPCTGTGPVGRSSDGRSFDGRAPQAPPHGAVSAPLCTAPTLRCPSVSGGPCLAVTTLTAVCWQLDT